MNPNNQNQNQPNPQPQTTPTNGGPATAAPVAQAPTPTPSGKTAKKPPAKTNPNSTQNSLQIAEIRDGIVIMNDGSFRSVIMAKSINFDLMSQGEQEGIELGYQQFLNSLDFPIQIFMRSRKIDLSPYIDKLDKIRSEHDNMLLAMLMEDYIQFIDGLSQEVNIMDKAFYVIVPFFSEMSTKQQNQKLTSNKNFVSGIAGMFNRKETHVVVNEKRLEVAKTELRNRVQAVLSGLMQCTVQGLPLDTQELIELYYDTYNPDTATRQQLKDFDGMTADIVSKGQGHAPQQHLIGGLE